MKYLLHIIIILSLSVIPARGGEHPSRIRTEAPVCYASNEVKKVFVTPPDEFMFRLKSGKPGTDIIVNYVNFPDSIKPAFEHAVSIWETLISSPVPIYIQARWETLDSNVLGSCGPTDFLINFDGAPRKDVYYPIALAEKLTGKTINAAGTADMRARFNSTIPWYFGTDGNTPLDKFDFVTVVLHEIAHGLGFTGFMHINETNSTGYSGYGNKLPAIYDCFLADHEGNHLTDHVHYPNPSQKLYNAFTSNQLYSASYLGTVSNNNNRPRIYAPSAFNEGSSIYHLNTATFFFDPSNALMTHSIARGTAIHDPGPVTRGMLGDLGWKYLTILFEPPGDIEALTETFTFRAEIRTDLGLDTASFFLYYSGDTTFQQKDSIRFVYDQQINQFNADFEPGDKSGKFYYYLSARDQSGRYFKIPDRNSEPYFSWYIGDDLVKPEIFFTPAAYVLSTDIELELTATVTDNLGVDTVYVLMNFNGIERSPIPLLHVGENKFSAIIPISGSYLAEGGILEYTIVAVDASRNRNTAISPSGSYYSLKVEKIFEPVSSYITDFNDEGSDFISADFRISKLPWFDSPALHTPNPYPNTGINDDNINLISILRYPIQVQNGGRISFDEVVLVEPGEEGSVFGDEDFWDFVIVEGSKDMGKSWLPLINGYDSRAQSSWLSIYNSYVIGYNSGSTGTKELLIKRDFSITENGNFKDGDIILIRFRLFSDALATGWGWLIDNLTIQKQVTTHLQTVMSPGHLMIWPNPFGEKLQWSYSGENLAEDLTLEMTDVTGSILKHVRFDHVYPGMGAELNTVDIPKGLYIVSMKSKGIPIVRKKMIKH